MRRLIALGMILAFALGFLYIGTAHRDRCLRAAQMTSCSMLPWSGRYVDRSADRAAGYGTSIWGPTLRP